MWCGVWCGWSSPDQPVVSATSAAAPRDRGATLVWVRRVVIGQKFDPTSLLRIVERRGAFWGVKTHTSSLFPSSQEGRSPGQAMGLPALFSHNVPIRLPTDLAVVRSATAHADHRCEPCRLIVTSSRREPLLGLVVVIVIINAGVLVWFFAECWEWGLNEETPLSWGRLPLVLVVLP